jgi:hypothetical protein
VIRTAAQAFVIVLALLIVFAEVQRVDDANVPNWSQE